MTRRRQLQHQLDQKRQQNANAPVSKLPLEILVEVFAIVKELAHLKEFHRVLQVCWHWRQAALDAPFLWTQPPAHKHQYTLLMLERSKNAPLTIRIGHGARVHTIKAILKHSARIRSLRCVLSTKTLDTVQRLLAASLTRMPLEDLKIMPEYHASKTFRLEEAAMCPPDKLRVLDLSTLDLDWGLVRAASNLRELYLNFICPKKGMSWEQLFDLLEGMPRLEVLSMTIESILIGQHLPATRRKSVNLDSLKLLDLRYGTEDQITYLLSHLACPELNDLRVGCNADTGDHPTSNSNPHSNSTSNSTNDNDNEYSAIIQAISNTLAAGKFGGGFQSLEIDGVYHFDLVMRRGLEPDVAPQVHVQLPYGVNREGDVRILGRVVRGLPVLQKGEGGGGEEEGDGGHGDGKGKEEGEGGSSVTELYARMPLSVQEFLELFGDAKELRTVLASDDSVLDVVRALRVPSASPSDHPPSEHHPADRDEDRDEDIPLDIPFPKLDTIILQFGMLEEDEERVLWDTTEEVLKGRADRGAKIKVLELDGDTGLDVEGLQRRFGALVSEKVDTEGLRRVERDELMNGLRGTRCMFMGRTGFRFNLGGGGDGEDGDGEEGEEDNGWSEDE